MTKRHQGCFRGYIQRVLKPPTPSSTSPYARLIAKVAAGDRAAFAALYDLLAPYLWACARAAANDERAARQLATDVFEELWVCAPDLATGPGCPLTRILAASHDALGDAMGRGC